MTFGWTFEHIDEFVTLPQLKEMSHFWEKSPPLHWKGGNRKATANEGVAAGGADFFRDFVAAGGTLPADLEEVK